nr:glycosyltransferase family 61 protein [Parvularcula dongshanensis]
MDRRPLNAASTAAAGGTYQVLSPAQRESNPLPINVADRSVLPGDPGWWGYAFRDVPERVSGETALVTLPNATLAFHTDPESDFHVCLIGRDGRALRTREIDYRRHFRETLSGSNASSVADAVWIAERVFHNHSHWLSAHLPKLCLLKELGIADCLVLPDRRSAVMDDTLRRLGWNPDTVRRIPTDRPMVAERLTLLVTDRFRPDLLRRAGDALRVKPSAPATARVYVSRAGAERRRLVNEDEVWPLFRDAGFERVRMEDLSFPEQLALMGRTAMLAAPHGAGLTNQIFCPEGATVIEMADPGFPNPNFYATACAMRHDYAIVEAESVGGSPSKPVERDLYVAPRRVAAALEAAGL